MRRWNALILCVFAGKWSVTGFLITRRSFSLPLTPLMLSRCKSCTMSPEKRLNVRGIRTCGFTCGCDGVSDQIECEVVWGGYLDKNATGGVDVYLQKTGFVQRGIEEREQAL